MLSKREYERKRREEQEAAAHVFQEFIDTFQNASPAPNKTFVKSGILYSDENQENDIRQLYNPKPIIRQNNTSSIKNAIECARLLKENNLEKSKKHEKPKSNLDILKEELKLRHSERGEREKLKKILGIIHVQCPIPSTVSELETFKNRQVQLIILAKRCKIEKNNLTFLSYLLKTYRMVLTDGSNSGIKFGTTFGTVSEHHQIGFQKEELDLSTPALSYFEGGDPKSTNLFVANLSSKVTENHLMLEFGAFGPLASVKIMWPRGDDKSRNSNCGFIAFMSRKDAERALKANKNREDMRVGWGKSVELPTNPIYIPNSLLKLYLPPPLTGLPFNAQPPHSNYNRKCTSKEFDDLLSICTVKVTIPFNKKVLMLVHRMVEFVVREGPMFEAFIMNKELGNPEFNFLFDYQNPVHIYYRWKLYSILVGDNHKNWSMKPFRMFKGGSIWLPPIAPNYTEGMPDELIKSDEKKLDETKLSESQCNRLVNLLRNLTMNRSKISEAMVFCLNHDLALRDSIEVIVESMKNVNTCPLKKIARLYLLSDVLLNSMAENISLDLEDSDLNLIEVFGVYHTSLSNMKTIYDKDNFRTRVLKVLHQWNVCRVLSNNFIRKVESLFLNNTETTEPLEDDNSSTDEPLDGANLLKRSLKNEIGPEVITTNLGEKKQALDKKQIMEYFVPSKWDTVDPQEVEAQAMSTEKMYYMELEAKLSSSLEEQRQKKSSKEEHKSRSDEYCRKSAKEKRKKSKENHSSDCSSKKTRNKKR